MAYPKGGANAPPFFAAVFALSRHCEERSDVAIRILLDIARLEVVSEEERIPTTSLRTGLGMTWKYFHFLLLSGILYCKVVAQRKVSLYN